MTTWYAAEMDHYYGRFQTKARAVRTLRALRLDERKHSGVIRLRVGFYAYTPPAKSKNQSQVYIGTLAEMKREGFGELIGDKW